MKFKFTFLLMLFMSIGYSQVTNQGEPASWKAQNLTQIAPVTMPKFDLDALVAEDEANKNRKDIPWRFGTEFLVDHNLQNSGQWHTLPNGDRIWRMRYVSKGAKTMNFLFSDFYMPKGAKVYLYNNDRTDLLGAYDEAQNNDERVLGTWLVKGEDIWIEYYEPLAAAGQGKLEIFKVVHGYRTSDKMNKAVDDDLNGSGNCNYDVECYMGEIDGLKDINKKAIALLITNNNSFCSGALVNNTSNNGTPYLLTANHCYSNPAQWAFRFNWISPDPVCAGTAPSTTNAPDFYQTASGAQLRARNAGSDFCLVQITANLPSVWDLVWAGWDRSDAIPSSTFGIHHPAGDIMKACVDLDAPTYATGQNAQLWMIGSWNLGVTEGGSSGSPLFNNNGRIIGQLYFGLADCNGTENNGEYDAYGRFAVSWDAGNNAASRLKEWLDPTNTGAMTVDAYPAQEVLALNARISILDLGVETCGISAAPVLRLINKGSQVLTSAVISYTLNDGTPAVYNWSGNLANSQATDIELPVINGTTGENILNVTLSLPNGGADGDTIDNEATANYVANVFDITNVNLAVRTDFYASETTWELRNENGNLLYNGGGNYTNNTLYNHTFNLSNEGCYTFTIFDEEGDGICCSYGQGYYTLTTEDGTQISTGGSFGDSESISFRLQDTAGTGETSLKAAVTVFPNPSTGVFNVNGSGAVLTYELYNVLGQQVKAGELASGTGTIDISSSASGVYILKLADSKGKTANYKLSKK
ncbi:T9SS type A sorting domain-containing protein [Flavobacterium sp. MFBS3-15]|uniref:T9SS type A sorting domain-containing protein n=1 Tax=Flavobacterium sp. MFBS3-15 TaxID=2989816 RepID=UPI00223604C4|nr:T9SS type A sorting domain-containing protein [Flavobacterium sp. MFBS3-15]MCW4469363.1 T9SS type A sorting domain-containing protein [Flavobacterium sp. MFBS3-15]